MSKDIRHRMSRKHEAAMAAHYGVQMSPGSGNQFNRPMDGRTSRHDRRYAFAWDGKASLAKTMSIGREMWAKAVEQARNERPSLSLQFYDGERLGEGPLLRVVDEEDFRALEADANTLHDLEPNTMERARAMIQVLERSEGEANLISPDSMLSVLRDFVRVHGG